MNGEIAVESEPGCGSTFWFTAAFALERRLVAPAGQLSEDVPTERRVQKLGSRLSILVAEDNEISQQIIALQLAELGCEATIVSDGLAAVEAAVQKPYALILMDWQMPYLDGVSATKLIRAGKSGRTPIVAMTASLIDERVLAENGFDGALPKPVTLVALRATCERWIGNNPLANAGP